jgi:hypothetical protein
VALPPTLYRSFGYWRYPPFVVAVNTFVPYFMAMMVIILLKTTWGQKRGVLKRVLAPKFLLRFGLSLLSFTGVSALLNLLLPFNLDYFAAIILFVVLYSLLDRFVAQEKQIYLLLPFLPVSVYLISGHAGFFLSVMAITAMLFLGLRFFIASLGDYLFVQEVPVSSLTRGAVPANIIVRDREGNYAAREISFTSFVSLASRPRDSEVVMDITPEGLSEEKVTELKALAGQGGKREQHSDQGQP